LRTEGEMAAVKDCWPVWSRRRTWERAVHMTPGPRTLASRTSQVAGRGSLRWWPGRSAAAA